MGEGSLFQRRELLSDCKHPYSRYKHPYLFYNHPLFLLQSRLLGLSLVSGSRFGPGELLGCILENGPVAVGADLLEPLVERS